MHLSSQNNIDVFIHTNIEMQSGNKHIHAQKYKNIFNHTEHNYMHCELLWQMTSSTETTVALDDEIWLSELLQCFFSIVGKCLEEGSLTSVTALN